MSTAIVIVISCLIMIGGFVHLVYVEFFEKILFTKKQELDTYKAALMHYKKHNCMVGICTVLAIKHAILHHSITFNIKLYSNFIKLKPKNKKFNNYWFSSYIDFVDVRIKVLEDIIKEMSEPEKV